MKAIGVKPNMVIYNTLLDAMGRAKRPENLPRDDQQGVLCTDRPFDFDVAGIIIMLV